MAITQTDAHKGGWSNVQTLDSTSGLYYTTFGGVYWFVGTGTPTHSITIGSMTLDSATGKIYRATDAAGTWEELT